jgi:uncharacterized protein YjbI with pentapeptide repeats
MAVGYGKEWRYFMNKLDPLVTALLGGGLITGIVALAGHFVTLWNSEQEARRQRETENEREQDAALQEYINSMKELLDDLLTLREFYREVYRDVYGDEFEAESKHELASKETSKHNVSLLQRLGRYLLQLRRYRERLRSNQVAEAQELAGRLELTRLQERAKRVAESQTIAILLRVAGSRKRVPLTLLYTLGLIHHEKPVLDLGRGADLTHADLTEAILTDVSMRFVNLRGADLQGADLSGSDLSYADLRGANLTNTDLSDANLSGANLLPYDENNPEELSFHNLKDYALPSDNYLRSLATLQEKQRSAELHRLRGLPSRLASRRPVSFTYLTDTKLAGANLTGAILANADLLYVRGLTQEQINSAIGNSETRLSQYLSIPKAWSEKAIERQIVQLEAEAVVPAEGPTYDE